MNYGSVRQIWRYVTDLHAFFVTPRGRTILILCFLGWLAYVILSREGNPNPLRRVENADPFVWPKGCEPEALVDVMSERVRGWSDSNKFPCACASPQNEIKDWYERGLLSRSIKYKFSYYRIGNDVVGIEKRMEWSSSPICFYNTRGKAQYKNFFIVNAGEKEN